MPIKFPDKTSIYFFNTETNEKLGQVDDVKSIDFTINQKDTIDRYGNLIDREENRTCTFDMVEPMDTDKLYKVLGIDKSIMPDKYDIQVLKVVQCRKHKKKRINKKWEKKYGYKQTYITMKGWKMRSNCNGEVEFTKDGE